MTTSNEPTLTHSVDPAKVAKFFTQQAENSNGRMYLMIANATVAILGMRPKAIKAMRENLVEKHGCPKGTLDPCFAIGKLFAPMVEADVREATTHEEAIKATLTRLTSLKGDVLVYSQAGNPSFKRGEESISWAALKIVLSPDSDKGRAPLEKPATVASVEPDATTPAPVDANAETGLSILLRHRATMTAEQATAVMDAAAARIQASAGAPMPWKSRGDVRGL